MYMQWSWLHYVDMELSTNLEMSPVAAAASMNGDQQRAHHSLAQPHPFVRFRWQTDDSGGLMLM